MIKCMKRLTIHVYTYQRCLSLAFFRTRWSIMALLVATVADHVLLCLFLLLWLRVVFLLFLRCFSVLGFHLLPIRMTGWWLRLKLIIVFIKRRQTMILLPPWMIRRRLRVRHPRLRRHLDGSLLKRAGIFRGNKTRMNLIVKIWP